MLRMFTSAWGSARLHVMQRPPLLQPPATRGFIARTSSGSIDYFHPLNQMALLTMMLSGACGKMLYDRRERRLRQEALEKAVIEDEQQRRAERRASSLS
eukprot:COSAG05_NODE_5137_length_1255_cov_1.137543_1_plen_99_part_00